MTSHGGGPQPLTDTERRCLRQVLDGGGDMVLATGGTCGMRGICAGEKMTFLPSTFLRLLGDGRLEFVEPRRLRITDVGRALL